MMDNNDGLDILILVILFECECLTRYRPIINPAHRIRIVVAKPTFALHLTIIACFYFYKPAAGLLSMSDNIIGRVARKYSTLST